MGTQRLGEWRKIMTHQRYHIQCFQRASHLYNVVPQVFSNMED